MGLKGTDGVADRARELGASPVSPGRAREALRALRRLLDAPHTRTEPHWLTGSGMLGAEALLDCGFRDLEVVHESGADTSRADTESATRQFAAGRVELILFCGGDGTARDICRVTGGDVPILGIPSGVKMYSGVFAINPEGAARLLLRYLDGEVALGSADILDLDEERYRGGEWAVRLYSSARTPLEPSLTQSAKAVIIEHADDEVKQAIAEYLLELMQAVPDSLYLLGPGSTVKAIGETLQIDKTLLGIDAVCEGRIVGRDLDERRILDLLRRHAQRALVLSPIGAQGFVLGRGNLPLSPRVIREVGSENLIVIATPAKLARTPLLHFDTGDAALDRDLRGSGYLSVVTGYRRRRMVPVSG